MARPRPLRDGLRASKDGTLHVDHRRFRVYPTRAGGAKLVPIDGRGKVSRPKAR